MTSQPAGAPTFPQNQDELRDLIAATIDVPPAEIPADQNLVELGLGSLQTIRLINRWRRLGRKIDYNDLAADPTLDGWWRTISTDGPAGAAE